MSFICKDCGTDHTFLPFKFAYPEEYLHLTEKERKEIVAKLSENLIVIRRKDHTHVYVRALWRQKIEGTNQTWDVGVWTMVNQHQVENLLSLQEGMSFKVTLQSLIPWMEDGAFREPLKIQFVTEYNELVVQGLNIKLPMDVALDYADDIHKNMPEVKCHVKPKTK